MLGASTPLLPSRGQLQAQAAACWLELAKAASALPMARTQQVPQAGKLRRQRIGACCREAGFSGAPLGLKHVAGPGLGLGGAWLAAGRGRRGGATGLGGGSTFALRREEAAQGLAGAWRWAGKALFACRARAGRGSVSKRALRERGACSLGGRRARPACITAHWLLHGASDHVNASPKMVNNAP